MAVVNLNARHPFGLNDEEYGKVENFVKDWGMRSAVAAVLYPLNHVKTLLQFGYEPFPLTIGKRWLVVGRDVYFLPNGFSYAWHMQAQFGVRALFKGLDAFLVSNVVGAAATVATGIYLDRHHRNVGGPPLHLEKTERELTDSESMRRMLRAAIRETIAKSAGVIASQPFRVIMIRQIAQLIGKETKYTNVFSSFYRIGQEEGLRGYFSGLVPQLLVELITIWGIHSLSFAIERAMKNMEDESANEEQQQNSVTLKKAINFVLPFAVNAIAYPFSVVATVMAVQGSGLAVAMMPYSPQFAIWQDAYKYLKPLGGFKRGSRFFFREQDGAVSVGRNDQQFYASYKHYA